MNLSPLSTTLSPLGVGPSIAAAAPFTPADVASLSFWWEADSGAYQDDAKITPATANNDPVGALSGLGGKPDATQATSGSRPPLLTAQIGGLPMIGGGAVFLGFTSLVLSGPWTCYCVCKRATSTFLLPLGSGGSTCIAMWSDNNIYFTDDGSNFPQLSYTGSAGSILMRFRNTSGNARWAAGGGMADTAANFTSASSFTFSRLLSRSGNSTTAGNGIYAQILCTADLVTSDPTSDTNILAYLTAKTGLTL